ncbi:MAG: hypothetical protein MUC65_07545 [Pontiellaceae bacterium]|nr:hypothetical protein [Pontiellaceae bacterium]
MAPEAAGQHDLKTSIKEAMRDEMSRNIENLALENLQKPFFISYLISDAKTLFIKSSLGAIVRSEEVPYRKLLSQVLVGNYQRNNLQFVDMNTLYSGSWPNFLP